MKKQETYPPPSKPETISTEGEDEIGKLKEELISLYGNWVKLEKENRMLKSQHSHSPAGSDEERDVSEVIEENQQLKTAIDKLTEALKLVREIHQPPQEQAGREAEKVLDWLLEANANGVNGDQFHKIILSDGEFYWETDHDGDQPMDATQLYALYKKYGTSEPAPSSVSNPVAFAEWLMDNRYEWMYNPVYHPRKWRASWNNYSIHTTAELYALFTSQPTEQGPDQEKLWQDVERRIQQDIPYETLMEHYFLTPKPQQQ